MTVKILGHLEMVRHFAKEDITCGGDYHYCEIYFNDQLVARYDDEYHDQPRSKFEGMQAILKFLDYRITTSVKDINDSDY